jgi:hypothetical protein
MLLCRLRNEGLPSRNMGIPCIRVETGIYPYNDTYFLPRNR